MCYFENEQLEKIVNDIIRKVSNDCDRIWAIVSEHDVELSEINIDGIGSKIIIKRKEI